MPQANVWVRKEDLDTWQAIPNKAEWLHAMIEQYEERATRKIKLPQFDKAITVPSTKGSCKNGHVADEWGRCLDKECKYGR